MNGTLVMKDNVKVGFFSIGLETYWAQFKGLKENLLGYHAQIREELESYGVMVVDGGLVDDPVKARSAGRLFREEGAEIVFLFISTYALSSTVLPAVQEAGLPVVVLNIQPVAQLDYEAFNALGDRGAMTGVWLEHCQACSAPEIACAFNRAGIDYHLVTGHLQDPEVWRELREWTDAARVRAGMRANRMGVLGHYYCGMLDVYSDLGQQSAVFGTHVELLEMCELHALREAVTKRQIAGKIAEFRKRFDVSRECEKAELERAARTSVALDALIKKHDLGSMAYYYEGQPGNAYENIVTSIIAGNTLLTGRGVPVAGECEVKNAQAMKIMDLFGAGGSFSEFYLADFKDDVVYLGLDGRGRVLVHKDLALLSGTRLWHFRQSEFVFPDTVKKVQVWLRMCEGAAGTPTWRSGGLSTKPSLRMPSSVMARRRLQNGFGKSGTRPAVNSMAHPGSSPI